MSLPDESSATSHSHAPMANTAHSDETTGATAPSTPWLRAKFVIHAIEVRLRFIALFVGIGLTMAYWTTLEAYWDRWTRPNVIAAAGAADSEYYCPMHPSVIRPGLEANGAVPSCPICGMPLSKRKKGELPELPAGVLTRIQLSPERVQLAGVKTVAASYMPLTKEIRTVGYVQYDESRRAEIVTRVSGYLEKLFVNKNFEKVEEGQPLAEIYSPQLYSSVQELKLAKKHGADDLAASARQRLRLLGVDDAELDDIIATGDGGARLVIRSPQSGQVIGKQVVEGASVTPGTILFQIADLSTVWIEADVYERDLTFLEVGQPIEAVVEAIPGKQFPGRIELIYPELNVETRTNRVRIVIENADLLLRPGMFATVNVRMPLSESEPFKTQIAERRQEVPAGDDEALVALQKICPVTGKLLGSMGTPVKISANDRSIFLCCAGCEDPFREAPEDYLAKLVPPPTDAVLSVPEQAVIDTGKHTVVYVEREPGLYEGVEVKLGPRSGGYYPVISGLTVGDRVAAAGSFLLDAETRLNPAAASAYFGASGQSGENEAPITGNGVTRSRTSGAVFDELSEDQRNQIDRLPPDDRESALEQRLCPITDEPLGSMGAPIKIVIDGDAVFLCCEGCRSEANADPKKILGKVKDLRALSSDADATPSHEHEY